MDIRNWAMNQIMQLPDSCFGRRFMISVFAFGDEGLTAWDISELGFPESCVIWEFWSYCKPTSPGIHRFRLALGDQLPTVTAEMDRLEPLFHGFGEQGPEPRLILAPFGDSYLINKLRMPIRAAGRRLVLEVRPPAAAGLEVQVVVITSSIPTEVPDCLLSV